MQLKVTWTPSATADISQYNLIIRRGGSTVVTEVLPPTQTEYILDNVDGSTNYSVLISAQKGALMSETITVTATSPAIVIQPPTDVVLEFIQ